MTFDPDPFTGFSATAHHRSGGALVLVLGLGYLKTLL